MDLAAGRDHSKEVQEGEESVGEQLMIMKGAEGSVGPGEKVGLQHHGSGEDTRLRLGMAEGGERSMKLDVVEGAAGHTDIDEDVKAQCQESEVESDFSQTPSLELSTGMEEGGKSQGVKVAGEQRQPVVGSVRVSGLSLHPVTWRGQRWLSSAEVSLLNPAWRGWDLLERTLAKRGLSFLTGLLEESKEEQLWEDMVEAGVGGLVGRDGRPVEQLVMFRVEDLEEILVSLGLSLEEGKRVALGNM